jgi:hypothetical protein
MSSKNIESKQEIATNMDNTTENKDCKQPTTTEHDNAQPKVIGRNMVSIPINKNMGEAFMDVLGWMGDEDNRHLCMCGYEFGHKSRCFNPCRDKK